MMSSEAISKVMVFIAWSSLRSGPFVDESLQVTANLIDVVRQAMISIDDVQRRVAKAGVAYAVLDRHDVVVPAMHDTDRNLRR